MANPTRTNRTYRLRIYPTRRQGLALEAQLGFACDLYNAALEQRRYAWRGGQRVGYVSQCRELTALRAAGDGPPQMSCAAMRSPLRRLERAYQAFFRRVKAGEKPGYPRFRSRRRYDSLTWDSAWSIQQRRLALQGIGHLKVMWHREMLSTGVLIPGPRAYRKARRQLRVAQRRVSRRVKGSRRRQKAGLLLARLHERIRNLRGNHAHQLSRRLVSDFGLIAVEDLQIRGLTRGFLAKDINDQGWAEFLRLLRYKAEDAGIQVVAVPPGGTSQTCSGCGARVSKPLSERVHRCPNCGLVVDRDINAARNILRLGMSRQAPTWPSGACVA
jgi:putative transposase